MVQTRGGEILAVAELEISIDIDEKSAIAGLTRLQDTFANMLDNLGAGVDELKKKWDQFGGEIPKLPKAPDPFETPKKSSDEFQKKMLSMGTALSASGMAMTQSLTQPITQFGQASFQAFGDFEKAMSGVKTVTGGTSESIGQLEAKAMTLGSTTKYSATEAANAMYFMGSAGWSTGEIMSGLEAVTTLATAADVDLATASEFCTSTMAAFGLTADQTSQFTDVLAVAAAKTNTDVTGMGAAMKYVAPVAGALGYSVQDTALAIGLMSNAGIKGEQAGTSLRASLSSLISPSTEAAGVMQQLGINMTDSSGKALPFNQVLGNLRTSFSGLSEDQKVQAASTLFGQEAMSGMLAVINASDEDFNGLQTSLQNSDGAAKDMVTTMGDNAPSKIEQMKAKINTLQIALGGKLAPAIEGVLKFVTNLLDWFSKLDGTTQGLVLIILGLVAAIGPVAGILGGIATITGVLSGVFGALIPILTGTAFAFGAITVPVWAVIAAIAAVIAIGVLLWKNWDTIKQMAANLWAWITDKFNAIKDAIVNAVSRAIDWVKSIDLFQIGKNMIQGLINGVVNMATAIWNAIVNTVKGAIDGAKKFLGISSPSKLMMEVGVNTGKGLIIGIDDTYDNVAKASRGLGTAVTDGYGQNNNYSNNMQSNVTINVRSAAEAVKEIRVLNKQLAMGW